MVGKKKRVSTVGGTVTKRSPGRVIMAVGAVTSLAAGALYLVGSKLVDRAFRPSHIADAPAPIGFVPDMHEDGMTNQLVDLHRANAAQTQERCDAWLSEITTEDVFIMSADGHDRLHGVVYPAADYSNKWALLLHGYAGTHKQTERLGIHYAQQGYNVLAPDLRYCGQSEGDTMGMGWGDRLDVISWVRFLIDRYGTAIHVVLHGCSMGAATAVMAAGEATLPPQVGAVVSDCAFSSVWEEFRVQLDSQGIPVQPALALADAAHVLQGGFGFKQASAVAAARRSETPTLFICGSRDETAPSYMTRELYDACAASRRLLIIDGATHAMACEIDPDLYFETVFDFIGANTSF